jgi:hypothetical protein
VSHLYFVSFDICLKAIQKLQKFGHLPSDAAIFKSYAEHGNFLDVRLAALEALVDFTKGPSLLLCQVSFLSQFQIKSTLASY